MKTVETKTHYSLTTLDVIMMIRDQLELPYGMRGTFNLSFPHSCTLEIDDEGNISMSRRQEGEEVSVNLDQTQLVIETIEVRNNE